MNQVIYTDPFLEDLSRVSSRAFQGKIVDLIDLLPFVPVLGSARISKSVAEKYGSDVRRIPVPPFEVVYRITDEGDFQILSLVHQRMAR